MQTFHKGISINADSLIQHFNFFYSVSISYDGNH